MGCAQSRIDNEEAVSRCKDRKILMKEAVLARSAFVVGHSAYAIALRNAGSALSDYGHGETAADTEPPPPSINRFKPAENAEVVVKLGMETPPPPPSEAGVRHFMHSNSAPSEALMGSSKVESVDASVPVDHAARVMRVITWSSKGVPDGGKTDPDDSESLATVLDKLLAWEKKLYEEVKAGELMKLEYQRKVSVLSRQKKRGATADSLEKTKAAVSHLHTRYIVDMQSMDSTVSEVNDLRDQQLYPKLVELVDRMAQMWEDISVHHDSQLQVSTELKSLDVLLAPRETSKPHYQCTIQLSKVIQQWQERFETLVEQQKHYIRSLNSWLKLNLIPIESSLKEKVSSPPRAHHPPIQTLLHAWHDSLEKLPDEVTRTAISSFSAVIKTIILHQEEEMRLKEKCEETRKEFLRKNQAFEDWYHKHMQRKGPEAMDPERGEDGPGKDPVSERQFLVETLRKRLEEEQEKHQRHCVQVREKSLGTLKNTVAGAV
uniref:Nitrate regulatory gene2 protein-like n=1 Tax=Chenopodium quinoa TaxID=63459 RepID=A0A803NDZ5_CHEQI